MFMLRIHKHKPIAMVLQVEDSVTVRTWKPLLHTVNSYNRYSEDQWIKSIFGTKRTVQKRRGTVKHKEGACVLPCPPKNPVDEVMGENTSSCCVRHSWKWRQLSSHSSNPLGHEHWRIFALLRTVMRLAGAFRTIENVPKRTKTIRKTLPVLHWPVVPKLEILCVPKTTKNRYVANRSGIRLFRVFLGISGNSYELSGPVPTPQPTPIPSRFSVKFVQEKSMISPWWNHG